MALSKNSGFSYLENYKVTVKGDKKLSCKVDKITKEQIQAEQAPEKDL